LARKAGGFEFREADARARAFDSRYYSADIHRGALALPPFVAEALAD
jgi:spermidine synthase